MNKENALKMLMSVLGSFRVFERMITELCGNVAFSGNESTIFLLLAVRLKMLSIKGIQATTLKEFEPLGGGIYSMHITGSGFNTRILYGFLPNREPALLLAFHERAGKRKTDYTPYIEPAQQRLRIMRERYENESYGI